MLSLSTDIAPHNPRGLRLRNPVMTASGTFGYGMEYAHLFDIQKLGAIICKGTTLNPREGNPQPRIAEAPNGLLNSIGLQNLGVDALIAEKAPVWSGWRVPVIVNIAGSTLDEYGEIAARLDGVNGVRGLEVNISCPNVKEGAIEFGANPMSAARVTEIVRSATSLPVIVKLTPNSGNIVELAEAVAEAGADAISLINTLKGMAIDIHRRQPMLGNISGGLSGPAVKPVALYMVYQVAEHVDIPIIGCGGVTTATDAIEFIMAGASAVQIGTANLINPNAPMEILKGIEDFMIEQKIEFLVDMVGLAHKL